MQPHSGATSASITTTMALAAHALGKC
jgi:hypothetical protein